MPADAPGERLLLVFSEAGGDDVAADDVLVVEAVLEVVEAVFTMVVNGNPATGMEKVLARL